ncbi:MAG: SDR family oxidoreductase [Lachnospiraceae bacterium]
MRFKHKSVIVTGAAAGMGLQIAKAFISEGAAVVAVDVNKRALEKLMDDAAEGPGRLIVYAGDVSLEEVNEGMIDLAVSEYGKLDILVNNAGIGGKCEPVGELTNEDWNKILNVNLNGPMYAIRKAVNTMLRQETGGSIISIASVAGIRGCRASAAYTAAKHGLVGLCRHTAFTYMHKGIRCNLVCPGAIKTDMSGSHNEDSSFGRERIQAGMDPVIPLGNADDIASAVLFVASDEARFFNGATLVVDGGVSCN